MRNILALIIMLSYPFLNPYSSTFWKYHLSKCVILRTIDFDHSALLILTCKTIFSRVISIIFSDPNRVIVSTHNNFLNFQLKALDPSDNEAVYSILCAKGIQFSTFCIMDEIYILNNMY